MSTHLERYEGDLAAAFHGLFEGSDESDESATDGRMPAEAIYSVIQTMNAHYREGSMLHAAKQYCLEFCVSLNKVEAVFTVFPLTVEDLESCAPFLWRDSTYGKKLSIALENSGSNKLRLFEKILLLLRTNKDITFPVSFSHELLRWMHVAAAELASEVCNHSQLSGVRIWPSPLEVYFENDFFMNLYFLCVKEREILEYAITNVILSDNLPLYKNLGAGELRAVGTLLAQVTCAPRVQEYVDK